jgi:hypothetical protein
MIMNATYKSRGGIGVLIVRIFASLPPAIIILGFAAGFFFVF